MPGSVQVFIVEAVVVLAILVRNIGLPWIFLGGRFHKSPEMFWCAISSLLILSIQVEIFFRCSVSCGSSYSHNDNFFWIYNGFCDCFGNNCSSLNGPLEFQSNSFFSFLFFVSTWYVQIGYLYGKYLIKSQRNITDLLRLLHILGLCLKFFSIFFPEDLCLF